MNSDHGAVLEVTSGKDGESVTCEVFSESVECPTDVFIDIDLGGIEEIPSENITDTFVPTLDGSSGGFFNKVQLDRNTSSEPDDSSTISSNSNGSSKVTISGYACFVQHERAELVKINPRGKLKMTVVNKKWANLSHEKKESFNNIARNLRIKLEVNPHLMLNLSRVKLQGRRKRKVWTLVLC